MATFRPAVKEDDSYIQKIIKYIPAEIITGYTACVGYLSIQPGDVKLQNYITYYLIVLAILFVITPVWTYFAVLDNDAGSEAADKKRAIFHSVVATFAFLIWVYALGNPLLKAFICKCTSTTCEDCGGYSAALGSIVLVLFTLLTPLLERIIFGKKPTVKKIING